MDLLQKIDGIYLKTCSVCGEQMFRVKRSEAIRLSWKFCTKSCRTIASNRARTTLSTRDCLNCHQEFLLRTSDKNKVKKRFCNQKCAVSFKNRTQNPAKNPSVRLKLSAAMKKRGLAHMLTEAARRKQAKTISGAGHWNWKGGITPETKTIRNSKAMKAWAAIVLLRDDYICQICKVRGGKLQADHIKRFADYPKLRLVLENGRTLCVTCHRKTDTYGGKKRNAVLTVRTFTSA